MSGCFCYVFVTFLALKVFSRIKMYVKQKENTNPRPSSQTSVGSILHARLTFCPSQTCSWSRKLCIFFRPAARWHWDHLSWTTSALSLRQVCLLLWSLSAVCSSPAASRSSLCTSHLICVIFLWGSKLNSASLSFNCSHVHFESGSESDFTAHHFQALISNQTSIFACGCLPYSQCLWLCLLIRAQVSLSLSGHLLRTVLVPQALTIS